MTADRNLEHQQHLSRVHLRVVVLMARTNRVEARLPFMPQLLAILIESGFEAKLGQEFDRMIDAVAPAGAAAAGAVA